MSAYDWIRALPPAFQLCGTITKQHGLNFSRHYHFMQI